MTLFIHSDILLDAVLVRTPFDDFAVKVLSLVDLDDQTLSISADSLLNVYYFTRKIAGKEAAGRSVGLLEQKLIAADTQMGLRSEQL